jgi:hydroxyethylthiazole kinase
MTTNIVAANFTANVRLAVGASTAMVVATEEIAEFAAIAAAVLINVGTVTNEAAKAMLVAAAL